MGNVAVAEGQKRLYWASVALVLIQVIHGAIPAETDAEGYFGLLAGLVALIAGLAAIYGLRLGRSWARPIAGTTGLGVAVGFLLYHALPITSSFTNPYWDEPKIGALQWAPVFACIAIGLWTAYEAFLAPTRQDALVS